MSRIAYQAVCACRVMSMILPVKPVCCQSSVPVIMAVRVTRMVIRSRRIATNGGFEEIVVVTFCQLQCSLYFLVFVRAATGRALRMAVAHHAPSGAIHISPLMITMTLISKVPVIIYFPRVLQRMVTVSQ